MDEPKGPRKRRPRPLVGKSANEPSPKVVAEVLHVLLQEHRQRQAEKQQEKVDEGE